MSHRLPSSTRRNRGGQFVWSASAAATGSSAHGTRPESGLSQDTPLTADVPQTTRPGRWERSAARYTPLLVAALVLIFLVRTLLAMQADGTTVDETAHLAYGERGLVHGTWARDDESLNSKMPVT